MIKIANVVEALAQPRMTKQQLADEMGITTQTLRNKLAGATEWTVNDVMVVSRLSGLSASELLAEDDAPCGS